MSGKPVALIIGTGIGGLSAGIALKKAGWAVRLFEKSQTLRASGSGLSVMSNASAAMKKLLDIDLGLERYGAPILDFEIRHSSGLLLKRLPFQEIAEAQGAPSVCISRQQLQQALLDKLGETPIHLGKRFMDFTQQEDEVQVRFEDGSIERGDILVGADGYHSPVRQAMGVHSVVQEAGYICWLALVKYSHPQITPGYVVHYWGKGKRVGIIDIGGGWVYWWGTANMPNHQAQCWQGSSADVAKVYSGWPPIVADIIHSTPSESIITVDAKDRSFPDTWSQGRVTLLGDAAHPMLTSLGQGAGLSIEDAAVLGHVLADGADPVAALARYQTLRQPRARTIVDASRALSEVEQYDRFVPRLKRDIGMLLAPANSMRERLQASLLFDDRAVLSQ
ncbi:MULTISPECIES: FAD-dependent monooxygenase [unclassified Pseudomonas]|uniref:FAD-dependent monooxygenase n=1 Tax=unclassified Pseudomonas TaxID=196821 RepID=UPI002448F0D0|nr:MULTISPECIES: FAD-dependent monooxygenase [unclassified Pseudomonas]MDH0302428.1 FAD-dependent monooxygenase [Pseudomonas sp. GD04091]MDH1985688.1 FAD-dependent monooxygenase [Pseudomonas sp. GD03689]